MIDIMYKCHCQKLEHYVSVKERGNIEDVLDFVKRISYDISNDHKKRSPWCRKTTMEYAKIPIENDVIGGTEKH